MKHKIQTGKLLAALAIPLATGAFSAFLTRDGMRYFRSVPQPPLSPPAWVFPVVWTLLYLMMGAASYLVLTAAGRLLFSAIDTLAGKLLLPVLLWLSFAAYLNAGVWFLNR